MARLHLTVTRLLLLAAFCFLPSAFCFSQSATATLSGTIEDENAAVIPGVEVTIENTGTTLRRKVETNNEGYFTVSLLQPGNYRVLARREGFARVQIPDVVLNVGDQKTLQIQLKAGDVKEEVQIINEAPLINESPAVATVIDRNFVGNLPLNGRSFQSLILLTPGVTVASGIDSGQFSVNGQRATTNSFIVDGVSANIGTSTAGDADKNLSLAGYYPGLSAFGATNNLVSVDALEEFKIQTSTYSAEFGRQPGGQVSIVTRSGTNQFHGSLFEYFRNERLDARNYFNTKPSPQTEVRQNQFGGTISGPVFYPNIGEGGPHLYNGKDRTFFFFSYEGQRLRLPTSGVTNVPSVRLRNAAVTAGSPVVPVLNTFPIPTAPELLNTAGQPTGFAPWNFSVSNPGTFNATGARIDHSVNTKIALFGRYNGSPSDTTSGDFVKFRDFASTQTLTLGATMVLNSHMNNELRFNYSKQHAKQERSQTDLGGAAPVEETLLTNGLGGVGTVSFRFGGQLARALGGVFADSYQRQLNVVDNLSVIKGNHQLKFGVDYRRLSPVYGLQSSQGVTFRNEAAVRNGIANMVQIINNDSARPQFTNFSVYAQDTWKSKERLTLSLGLRWELNPPPTTAEDKTPPVVIGIVGNDVSNATLAPAGTQAYETFYNAFAPRLGVAYQLNQTSGRETVVRGGFGVYYDLGSTMATAGFPFSAVKNLANIPFPLSATAAARPTVIIPTSLPVMIQISSNDPELKLPYSLHWNIAVEQSLGMQQAVSLSYVASAGRRLLKTDLLNFGAGFVGPPPNANFSFIQYTSNGPTSKYDSMQAQHRGRFKHGLQTLINYTWSHAIDEISSDLGGNLARGDADFDVRHNVSAALTYNLPSPGAARVLKHVLGNWSLDAIVHGQSGRPVDVFSDLSFIRGDGTFFSLRPDLVSGQPFYLSDPTVPGGRRFNALAFASPPLDADGNPIRQGTFGRNVLRELPIYQVDVAVGRSFNLSETWKLKFKAEAFNLFNHPMFGRYGERFTTPTTFGVPSRTLNNSLGGLSSLYQLGGPRSIQLSLRLSF